MSKIAIKSHISRGKEIIEILEILGGKNIYNLSGNTNYAYYVLEDGEIRTGTYIYGNEPYTILALEKFLEKYPYKIGDEVINDEGDIVKIFNMRWSERVDEIYYSVILHDDIFEYPADLLQPYKKEPKELLIGFTKDTDGNWVLNTHKDYEIKEVDGKFKLILKKPQYPKTYDECCKVLFPNTIELGKVSAHGYKGKLLTKFGELLICRDAYWKIAGKEMGLGKPWEPDFTNIDEERYGIYTIANKVEKDFCGVGDVNMILTFPTEEMRDAFYENFKELIKQCKELL